MTPKQKTEKLFVLLTAAQCGGIPASGVLAEKQKLLSDIFDNGKEETLWQMKWIS